MLVKFTALHGIYKAGEIARFTDEEAMTLVNSGKAVAHAAAFPRTFGREAGSCRPHRRRGPAGNR